ncbi:MAG: hypothetical protein AB7I01_18655 [Gammaproteobacteria bacterium]
MANDVRLKALTRLAQSDTEAAKAALLAELDDAAATLQTQSEYEALSESLDVLSTIGYRFSARTMTAIEDFVRTIEARKLTYSQAHESFADYIATYSNAQSLVAKAVETAARLRYYETKAVLRLCLTLFQHPSERVRKAARSGIDSIAKYDLDVFYGSDREGGLGPAPQSAGLDVLESMDEKVLKANHEAALRLLSGMLSPILEGVSWTYKSATISQGIVPAHPSVSDVRARSIQLLIRLYSLGESTQQKLATINALSEGTRTDHRGAADEKTRAMIARNTVEILELFAQLVVHEDFQIIQKIESNSYWMFVHSLNDETKAAALKVEKAIAGNDEYAIYRTLIGFEGVFGDWSTYERTSQQIEAIEKERRSKASYFAKSITTDIYPAWRERILAFAKTESDDLATFPVFYHFLAEFASAQPALALRLITEDTAAIARFLIPVLSSLWNGNHRNQVRELIEKWIGEAQLGVDHHLFSAIKMFLSTKDVDIELLKRLLEKTTAIGDISSVRQVLTVALVRWRDAGREIVQKLFYPAVDQLTEMKNASWIFEAWFRQEARDLFAEMDAKGMECVLRNLLVLDKIDYHAEEVLHSLAQRGAGRVVQFLIERIRIEAQTRSREGSRDFDAIPFEFHKLQDVLSKNPGSVVRSVLDQYRTDNTLFAYRGATLLKNIFPTISKEFEEELLRLVREGGDGNLEFVLGLLRNYHGEPFTHTLCKEIVKAVDAGSSLLNEVAIALETTGVVSGEFGMAEAYERKKQEIADWLSDPDEKVRAFATRYTSDLEQMRDSETKRAEEDIALRKHRFGE